MSTLPLAASSAANRVAIGCPIAYFADTDKAFARGMAFPPDGSLAPTARNFRRVGSKNYFFASIASDFRVGAQGQIVSALHSCDKFTADTAEIIETHGCE